VRAACVALLLLLLAAAAGCGGADRPATPRRAVQLSVVAPGDAATVDADEVELRGRVAPSTATVTVLGREVEVSGGSFSTTVSLEEGANLIDVAASAPGRRPASTALRVVRQVPVEIPDVEGDEPEAAVEALEGLGLDVRLRRGGGLLDSLLPGDVGVCSTDPDAGTKVRPGSAVTVEVAKVC
jgi:hypothetical protein